MSSVTAVLQCLHWWQCLLCQQYLSAIATQDTGFNAVTGDWSHCMHVATQDTENNAITRNTEDSESTAITGDITDAARSPETLKHCCYWKHWNENNVVTENTAVIDNGNTEDISVTGSEHCCHWKHLRQCCHWKHCCHRRHQCCHYRQWINFWHYHGIQ